MGVSVGGVAPSLKGGGIPGATPEKFLKNKDFFTLFFQDHI